MTEECIFCKIQENTETKKIYENDNFFSVFDIAPQVKGHALVISKNHYKTLLDMPNTITDELMDCIKSTALKLMKDFYADGFNVLANTNKCAGQIVDHVHFHILPRKTGDEKHLSLK